MRQKKKVWEMERITQMLLLLCCFLFTTLMWMLYPTERHNILAISKVTMYPMYRAHLQISTSTSDGVAPGVEGVNTAACKGSARDVLLDLLDEFLKSGLKLIITQASDLADESDFIETVFLNGDEPVTRVGVFSEDLDVFKVTIETFLKHWKYCPTVQSKQIMTADPRPKSKGITSRGKIMTHVFLIIPLNDPSKAELEDSSQKTREFFNWKRIHFQILHKRGVSTEDQPQAYRWIGEEPDDSLQYKRPAESYDAFTTRPIKDVKYKHLFEVPSDKRFFIWEKEAAEFKECPVHSEADKKKFEDKPKGRKVTDPGQIRIYIHSLMVTKQLLQKVKIHAWLSCGTLLGWYRQCSVIAGDGDVDVNHFNNPDVYPNLHVEVVKSSEVVRIRKKVVKLGPDPEGRRGPGLSYDYKINSSKLVDVWRVFRDKAYTIRGGRQPFVFHDKVCSADLHGYRVYVLCTKNRDQLTHDFGEDIMTPKQM